jgi:flagellin
MATSDLSRINTNISAMNALNALNSVNNRLSTHSLRLATGKQINSASDDAAGFTIASKLRVKSEGLGTALDNIGSSKNLMTVAEGHLTNIQDILVEMKAKAQQAANDTLGDDERNAIYDELVEFNAQIDAEIEQAQWAGVNILGTGSASNKTFQIGVGTSSADTLSFFVANKVWSGNSTTFDSSGLNIVATTTGFNEVSASLLSSQGTISAAMATAGSSSSTLSMLASGEYTLEISTTAAGSAGSVSVSVQLKNSAGVAQSIDADGVAGGASATTLAYTTSAGSIDAGLIDLGIGFSVDLGALAATTSGATTSASYTIDFTQGNTVSSQSHSQSFMGRVDEAINKVSEGLSYIGSMINRLDFQENSITVAQTNTDAAYSRIVDADMAEEQLEVTKLQILQQTATSMLAQANTSPQAILSLFS